MEIKRTVKLRQAKASKEDVSNLCNFMNLFEEYFTCGSFTYENEKGETVEEDLSRDRFIEVAEQLWMGDWINRESGVGSTWQRIVFGYETLVDNACNPDSDFLEWRSDIAEFLDNK